MTLKMTRFPKNMMFSEKEELRAEVKNLRGRQVVDLRVWAAPKVYEAKWPTGKGLLIPISRWPEFRKMLVDLGTEIEAPSAHE